MANNEGKELCIHYLNLCTTRHTSNH